MSKWHRGPPPSVGWWPASFMRSMETLRWWDGVWSRGVSAGSSAATAARAAIQPEQQPWQSMIEWRGRPASWPERSRT